MVVCVLSSGAVPLDLAATGMPPKGGGANGGWIEPLPTQIDKVSGSN